MEKEAEMKEELKGAKVDEVVEEGDFRSRSEIRRNERGGGEGRRFGSGNGRRGCKSRRGYSRKSGKEEMQIGMEENEIRHKLPVGK
ncbi:uncharacterized protein MONOS_15317 [Monocercomonoides exilis]|uniref:uncharacterized protein n=1 Tax=Monocercomonoides exilis TaxID=2049356 RepID=UPI00355A248F|nr:hypothetical protein MONOS_15317 [Monocercomonoides exilis]|eukprot:MONOS_15317.1-p1 / transcript=MONOS_15317.1 / gene=MONOS_15317 / organism=Monocercomonoides_exilis_PA203 / gene_product=unspecified product / transcript_product=unspecified product / location=Mono_scaffold01197:8122-8379(-) / protein_length=86 / sequence_SO=supercontig / SO=protein_coding / is_pseudo=false